MNESTAPFAVQLYSIEQPMQLFALGWENIATSLTQ